MDNNFKPFWPETVLIIGAGASVELGLPTTADIARKISILAGVNEYGKREIGIPIEKRIDMAFDGSTIHPVVREGFKDMLLLLHDGDDASNPRTATIKYREHANRMLVKYGETEGIDDDLLKVYHNGIDDLADYYDWIGVRALAPYLSKEWNAEANKPSYINYLDLLTAVDQLLISRMAVPTEELYRNKEENEHTIYMLGQERLLNVKKCLMHLSSSIQRVSIQSEPGRMNQKRIEPYWKIAQALAEMMVEEAWSYSEYIPNMRQFYLYSYSVVSFNWDPVMLWLLFNAHKAVNKKRHHVRDRYLGLYDDCGDGIGIQRIEHEGEEYDNDIFEFMMSEPVCKRVNRKRFEHANSSCYRIGKFLFPHGGLGWRICPRCGKLVTTIGSKLGDVCSSVAFGPDLLPEINQAWQPRTQDEEMWRKRFYFGAIQCVFCGSMTHPYDAPLVLQSAIKLERYYVLEGIFREMGLLVGNARHAVFAGYTLPPDDTIYRSFFMAARAGRQSDYGKPYCSLISFDPRYVPSNSGPWLKGDEIIGFLDGSSHSADAKRTIQNLLRVYDKENMRVTLMGFPKVVVDHPVLPLAEALKDLLYPRECFPEGFPPKRDR
jgi:hypothetical protein